MPAYLPSRKLTRAGTPWKWESVEQEAFESLKKAILREPLAYFISAWDTEVVADAGSNGIGAVLFQRNPTDPSEAHEITNVSRMLTDVGRRYSQCEKEALGAVWACERLWIYLIGKPFTLITGNRSVQLLFASTTLRPPARIERMALRLSQFDYKIVHKPGISNIADYYSRHPNKGHGSAFLEEVKTEQNINAIVSDYQASLKLSEVISFTDTDIELTDLIKHIRLNTQARCLPKHLQDYKHLYDELNTTEDGVLLRGQRIVIPEALRVVRSAHVGHQGIVKTKTLIRSRVWYPGIDKQVEDKVQKCRECQANEDQKSFEPMCSSDMPAGPWQKVSGDFFWSNER